MTIELYR